MLCCCTGLFCEQPALLAPQELWGASGLKLRDETANTGFFEKYLEHVALFPFLSCLLTRIKIYYFFLIFSFTDSLKHPFPSTFQGTCRFSL